MSPLLLTLYCLTPLPALGLAALIVNVVVADLIARREAARTAREIAVNEARP